MYHNYQSAKNEIAKLRASFENESEEESLPVHMFISLISAMEALISKAETDASIAGQKDKVMGIVYAQNQAYTKLIQQLMSELKKDRKFTELNAANAELERIKKIK